MAEKLPRSLKNLDLNTNREPKNKILVSAYLSSLRMSPLKSKPPSLVNLCIGVIGKHLEERISCLADISVIFPADIKMSIAAIARRRKLLDDDVIISLADSSWKILDVSGSDVTNSGLAKVAEIADVVPQEALPDVALDEPFVKDIDPKTWVVTGVVQKPTSFPLSNELPIAEKFRLAFAERDARLAPKRANNARQHQRHAERDWMMSSDKAKAMVLASKATRSLHKS